MTINWTDIDFHFDHTDPTFTIDIYDIKDDYNYSFDIFYTTHPLDPDRQITIISQKNDYMNSMTQWTDGHLNRHYIIIDLQLNR